MEVMLIGRYELGSERWPAGLPRASSRRSLVERHHVCLLPGLRQDGVSPAEGVEEGEDGEYAAASVAKEDGQDGVWGREPSACAGTVHCRRTFLRRELPAVAGVRRQVAGLRGRVEPVQHVQLVADVDGDGRRRRLGDADEVGCEVV